ncbi:hypothetical protein ACUXST_002157 [Sphingomonas sp. F9_3S_D5_B_2]
MNMPGMTMPVTPKAAAKKAIRKAGSKTRPAKRRSATPRPPVGAHPKRTQPQARSAASKPEALPTDHRQMDHGAMSMATPTQPQPATPMDHSEMRGMMMPAGEHASGPMTMTGALGPYPMERESSGTAWQPDTTEHSEIHAMSGGWTLMAHGVLNLVYDRQGGRRGDEKAFASGMLMGMARRPLGDGTLQLKAMVSPDPLMGRSGYPLLLAAGETANGTDRLVDRQHPHDLFMELSASVSQNVGPNSSVFLYAGLPGEPAFGPPAFMHREAILDSPEAPITHHWLDSTHITFGVVTGGVVLDRLKIEASRFNAREPDQRRWDLETGSLDSTSLRVSWNPSRTLALQGSWGRFKDPEQLEPGVDQTRWSASALWANEVAPGWKAAATLAWGRRSAEEHSDDGFAAEASLKHARWTLFGRGELTENRELAQAAHGPALRVGKVSAGAVRDFRIADHLSAGVGGLFSVNFVPDSLAASYGGNHPTGAMGFVRLKLD